jgi:hypothetical protein
MRPDRAGACRVPRAWIGPLLILLGAGPLRADDPVNPRRAAGQARAPADYSVLETDRAGATFIPRPLLEQHDALRRRLAELRAEIDEARIDGDEARRRLDALNKELADLTGRIDAARVYVRGAAVHTTSETTTIPVGPDDRLLIEAPQVEIRGWDRPELRCVVEKLVLGDPDDLAAEFAGIAAELRRIPSKEVFGFYHDIRDKPQWKNDWEAFRFKDYLGEEIVHVRLKGLTGQEGNRFLSLEARNEQGAGVFWGRWQREARVTLYVPKCRSVGVIGAQSGFRVANLDAALVVQGSGDRDYTAVNEVVGLGGSLVADNLPLHRVEDVRGDAELIVTEYPENSGQTHDARGVVSYVDPARPMAVRRVSGALKGRYTRADLTLEQIHGKVDIENDFGRTTWALLSPPAVADHRIVAQGGTIELQLAGAEALGPLALNLSTECGTLRIGEPAQAALRLESTSYSGIFGEAVRRWWHGFTRPPKAAEGEKPDASPGADLDRFERAGRALRGEPRPPGIDLVSRGGTVGVSLILDPGR